MFLIEFRAIASQVLLLLLLPSMWLPSDTQTEVATLFSLLVWQIDLSCSLQHWLLRCAGTCWESDARSIFE